MLRCNENQPTTTKEKAPQKKFEIFFLNVKMPLCFLLYLFSYFHFRHKTIITRRDYVAGNFITVHPFNSPSLFLSLSSFVYSIHFILFLFFTFLSATCPLLRLFFCFSPTIGHISIKQIKKAGNGISLEMRRKVECRLK